MTLIQAEDFSGKAVVVDDKHFHNCRFTKTTTLIYEGGEWAETSCTFEAGVQLSFSGAAARTMAVMARFGMIRPVPMPLQPPAVSNPPGTIQ
ncbi:MAG TPA: hypothetical protein VKU01_36945 [Bryobacteraceae bacterium]|nr:hypothetical protein [Bryobacteraceae bacterium]